MTSSDGHSEANHPPGLVNGEARELKTMVDKVVFIVSGADNTGIICIVSSSLQESRLTLTSAMREREAHSEYCCPHYNGHKDIEKIEAECEVSGVTKIILKTSRPVTC